MTPQTDYEPGIKALLNFLAPVGLALLGFFVTASRFEEVPWGMMLGLAAFGAVFTRFPRPLADMMGDYIGYLGRGPMINRKTSGVVVMWMFRLLGWFLLCMPLFPSFSPSGN